MFESASLPENVAVELTPENLCAMDYVDGVGVADKVFACSRTENSGATCSALALNDEGIICTQGVCQAMNSYSNAMHYQS